MRDIQLCRAGGKTTRLLALSEFHNAPIICASESNRKYIIGLARKWDYDIPYPLTAAELAAGNVRGSHIHKEFLIDESQDVALALVSALTGGGPNSVLAMTTNLSKRGVRRA